MSLRDFPTKTIQTTALILTAGLFMACASAGPQILTATQDEVSIEFPTDGKLGDAAKLAQDECSKNDRTSKFIAVETAATPTTRVAKFECVTAETETSDVAAAPADADAPDSADAAPEADDSADADSSDATPDAGTE